MLLFQFARRPGIDIVPDVFFAGQHLMHCPPVPSSPVVRQNALRVQTSGNLGLQFPVGDELMVNPPHDGNLLVRSGDQHHAVGLDALLFTHFQLTLFDIIDVH